MRRQHAGGLRVLLTRPKDAAKRYQFFLRAANLEPLKNDYKAAYKEKATVEERLRATASSVSSSPSSSSSHSAAQTPRRSVCSSSAASRRPHAARRTRSSTLQNRAWR